MISQIKDNVSVLLLHWVSVIQVYDKNIKNPNVLFSFLLTSYKQHADESSETPMGDNKEFYSNN